MAIKARKEILIFRFLAVMHALTANKFELYTYSGTMREFKIRFWKSEIIEFYSKKKKKP